MLAKIGVAGEAIGRGDLDAAKRALVKAGQAMDDLARRTSHIKQLSEAGRSLEKSLSQLTGGDNLEFGDGKGTRSARDRTQSERGRSQSRGRSNDSARRGSGDGSRKSAGARANGAGGDTGNTTTDAQPKPGELAMDGMAPDVDSVTDRDGVKVSSFEGMRPDGSFARGARKMTNLPPFAVTTREEKEDAIFLYEEKVNDYLARENVPNEYRKIIKSYFGLPKPEKAVDAP